MGYSLQSVEAAAALPGRCLFSTAQTGWSSLLLECRESNEPAVVFDALITEDHVVVVALDEFGLDFHRDGRWHSAVCRAGSYWLLPPGEPATFRLRSMNSAAKIATAHLFLPQAIFSEAQGSLRSSRDGSVVALHSLMPTIDATLHRVVLALMEAARNSVADPYASATGRWIAHHLIAREGMSRPGQLEAVVVGTVSDPRIARAIEMMNLSLHEAITLDWMAAQAGVSKFHFVRLFRRQTGRSPGRFLADLRMRLARQMIGQTDMPVYEIALRCGFPRSNNFTSAFTRHFGRAPTDMRPQIARTSQDRA